MLIAAKMLFAKNCKSEIVPTVIEWQVKCQYVLLMNKLQQFKDAVVDNWKLQYVQISGAMV